MQHNPLPVQPPAESDSPTPVKRGKFQPKHFTGLIILLIFVIGVIAAGSKILSARDGQSNQNSAEPGATGNKRDAAVPTGNLDIFAAMSVAMLEDDREGFIHWGEGPVQEQLARIWDETKKIGWTVGVAIETRTDSILGSESLRGDGLLLAFDLGFTHQRFAIDDDGPIPNCTRGSDGCGILTQQFEYDITLDTSRGGIETYRITALSPRTPMPWDDPMGVYAVRQENSVIFGYADEAHRVDAMASGVQLAAAGVLATEVATAGYSDIPGFPAFVTDDATRFQQAVYGVGEHVRAISRDWEAAAVSIPSPPLDITNMAYKLGAERGLLSEISFFGGQSGALSVFNGLSVPDDQHSIIRVAAHEFAHTLEQSTFNHYSFDSSQQTSANFGAEGYARYIEDIVGAQYDGTRLTLDPAVRAAVVSTPDEGLSALVGGSAFSSSATNEMAYNVAGNYFAFLAELGVDLPEVIRTGEYLLYDPYAWLGRHHPITTSGETVDATPAAWRAWNSR